MKPESMISTSAEDLRSSMECALMHDPAKALEDDCHGLIAMAGKTGMSSKRAVLGTCIRKAVKLLE